MIIRGGDVLLAMPALEKTQVNGKTLRLIQMAVKAHLGLFARNIAQLYL
jgi:hypothetical protein